MEFQDYYKTLGIARNATPEEIKKQYRRLARKYHPDVSKEPNAETMFKKVREAYEVLKDPEKRKAYDQFGGQWKQGQGFQPPPGWQQQTPHGQERPHARSFHTGEFSDFFESIFGSGFQGTTHRTGHQFRQKGQDQHSKIAVGLEEAFHGTQRALTLREQHLNAQTGEMEIQSRQINVKIPAGVTQNQHIRLSGLGSPGIGGAPHGDLYLEIELLPHALYTVEGRDIYLKLPITPWEAALGAEIETPTLAGSVKLKIPPGSQTGNKLRLKGRGLPGKETGDEYVLLSIYIPEPKNAAQQQLYQQMKETMNFDPRKNMPGAR
ncbi:MAG: cytochrome C biogenesis protein [Gammaproteobacteria bacterium RIFCSPHIGHO2_12_FULL_41_15]|nr:MAG: cytochrome C biogenesis protein [Gammaproteobacteria bacterium RIFCSPHIGHO2_12_FULL_41_15]